MIDKGFKLVCKCVASGNDFEFDIWEVVESENEVVNIFMGIEVASVDNKIRF